MTGGIVWLVAAQTALGKWAPLFAVAALLAALVGTPRRDAQPFVVAKPPRRVNLARRHGPAWLHPCAYCLVQAQTWDHVIPLARGGSHDPENMAPACVSCNSSKGDQTPEEWWSKFNRGEPFPAHWPRSFR